MGEWRISSSFLTINTRWRWRVSFTSWPLYRTGTNPWLGELQLWSGSFVEEETFLSLPSIEGRFLHCPAGTLVTIGFETFRLYTCCNWSSCVRLRWDGPVEWMWGGGRKCIQVSIVTCSGGGGNGVVGTGFKPRWGDDTFRTYPDRTWGSPGLLCNGYRVFWCTATMAWRWTPTPFYRRGRVCSELYLYLPSVPVVM